MSKVIFTKPERTPLMQLSNVAGEIVELFEYRERYWINWVESMKNAFLPGMNEINLINNEYMVTIDGKQYFDALHVPNYIERRSLFVKRHYRNILAAFQGQGAAIIYDPVLVRRPNPESKFLSIQPGLLKESDTIANRAYAAYYDLQHDVIIFVTDDVKTLNKDGPKRWVFHIRKFTSEEIRQLGEDFLANIINNIIPKYRLAQMIFKPHVELFIGDTIQKNVTKMLIKNIVNHERDTIKANHALSEIDVIKKEMKRILEHQQKLNDADGKIPNNLPIPESKKDQIVQKEPESKKVSEPKIQKASDSKKDLEPEIKKAEAPKKTSEPKKEKNPVAQKKNKKEPEPEPEPETESNQEYYSEYDSEESFPEPVSD